ncbi:CpaF family protein [Microbacterium sufflavum]|uniref:CpaF family protein n=1 Tax=Microbacterium sufflavum TaxID=2851649 RepID=UPI002001338B|nr:ATPase, T2SS/T4P/T4SS family [Microbacterium sufflavum]
MDDETACISEVLAAIGGFGVLQPLLDAPDIEEIWVNGDGGVHVARGGTSERTGLRLDETVVRDLVERMLHSSGRRVDIGQPFVDASLPDGSRLHVAIADVVRGAWSVNIRKFLTGHRTLDELVAQGSLPPATAAELATAMREGATVIVSGATHAGKTTILGALLAACASSQRIVTVEETFELAVGGPDVVALQGRQPSLEGTGEITLRRLVKEALRMRPDRLVVGEVRDAEALDLVLALNTGVLNNAKHTLDEVDVALLIRTPATKVCLQLGVDTSDRGGTDFEWTRPEAARAAASITTPDQLVDQRPIVGSCRVADPVCSDLGGFIHAAPKSTETDIHRRTQVG